MRLSKDQQEIARIAKGYSKQDIQATMNYFYDLREECRKIMEERLWYSTAPELLAYRLASFVIDELWVCRMKARDEEDLTRH